jgi:hypothetical protein
MKETTLTDLHHDLARVDHTRKINAVHHLGCWLNLAPAVTRDARITVEIKVESDDHLAELLADAHDTFTYTDEGDVLLRMFGGGPEVIFDVSAIDAIDVLRLLDEYRPAS